VEKSVKGDVKTRAKDGSYYWINSTIVPFCDNDGRNHTSILP
jgi:hypothetical protein